MTVPAGSQCAGASLRFEDGGGDIRHRIGMLICLQQQCSLTTSTSPLSLTTVNQEGLS
jgi:hypothetical protein